MKNKILLWVALLLMVFNLYMIFIYAPIEKEMGIVQKIFYLMVPAGWLALLSFLIVLIGSSLYLKKREGKWDTLAYSAAETGIIFTTMTLIVGSTWARPIWGAWWVWEPRLTATLVLWLIYLAYFLVRSFTAEESRAARFSAVVGIVGAIDVPIVILAIVVWRTIHPPPLIFQGGLAPEMLQALVASITAYTVLYVLLLIQRVNLKIDETEITRLKRLLREN